MVSIISVNVNKTKLPATKRFTIVHTGYETWLTGATLIEIGVYNRDLPNVSTAVRKNRNILQSSNRCKEIFPSPPIVSYKRSTNLGDLLVRSTLRDCSIQQEKPSPDVSKCNHPRCMPYLSIF